MLLILVQFSFFYKILKLTIFMWPKIPGYYILSPKRKKKIRKIRIFVKHYRQWYPMKPHSFLYIQLSQSRKWLDFMRWSTITQILFCLTLIPSNLIAKSIIMWSHFHSSIGNGCNNHIDFFFLSFLWTYFFHVCSHSMARLVFMWKTYF